MRTIELFYELTNIPRCSKTHQPFIEYINRFAKKCGYICKVDNANNILCYKKEGKSNICLQSHYDIVCLEEGKVPVIVESEGYLKAKDSTLGADNGIGCAIMMALMEEDYDIELLFTCDEEIGLIGANNIELELRSKYMLNLDSEAEGEICIGCAGGIDIQARHFSKETQCSNEGLDLYEIDLAGLEGGHSGVDIDKAIPNAIKLTAESIKRSNGLLLDINGGERINSIPKSCQAIVASSSMPIPTHPNMQIKRIGERSFHHTVLPKEIAQFAYSFAHGVRGFDSELGVVFSSINLAMIKTGIEDVTIDLSARAMCEVELGKIKEETVSLLEFFGFECSTSGKYPPWKPDNNEFTRIVQDTYKKHLPTASLEAIHAGLECAIFKDKFPDIKIASIGPNIYFPHSLREECEISSVHKIYKVTKDIVKNANIG